MEAKDIVLFNIRMVVNFWTNGQFWPEKQYTVYTLVLKILFPVITKTVNLSKHHQYALFANIQIYTKNVKIV